MEFSNLPQRNFQQHPQRQPNQDGITRNIAPVETKKFKITRSAMLVGVALILILGLAVFSFLQYRANQRAQAQLQNIQNKVPQTDAVIQAVGKLIVLPENETPTIASVTDLDKLKGQAFFDNAKVGDKVLIYSTAKKAILYDPVANKIVEVAPLNLGNASTTRP